MKKFICRLMDKICKTKMTSVRVGDGATVWASRFSWSILHCPNCGCETLSAFYAYRFSSSKCGVSGVMIFRIVFYTANIRKSSHVAL